MKSAPGKPWISLKGEDVKEIEVCRKHALVDKKGVIIGEVVHEGLVLITQDKVTDKRYAIGDVKCTHKFTKNGKRYIIGGTENMKQEVVPATVTGGAENPMFVGEPKFSDLRNISLTKDGVPQSVMAVQTPTDKSGRYIIQHSRPRWHPVWVCPNF